MSAVVGIRRLAVRRAVSRAHAPLTSRPRQSTATPQPVTTHQPTWLALAKPSLNGPCSAEIVADPMMATPSDEPTCLLVEATPAATPACDRGIPDTVLFVIGALPMPKPSPKRKYPAISTMVAVPVVTCARITPAAAIPAPATIRDGRVPLDPTRRPDNGEQIAVIAAIGSM